MKQLNEKPLVALRCQSHVAHAYNVEVSRNGDYVLVHASNRTSAAATAKKAGYEVRSVNMVG